MNTSLFNFFFSLSTNPTIAWSALFISNILIYVLVIFTIIISYLVRRDIFNIVLMLGVSVFAFLSSYLIKIISKIPRPFIELKLTPLFMESGFSFPSSHVTVISAISVIAWNIDYRLGIIFFAFTLLVAISRMIIGVHYPIDVLGGLIIGVGIGLFCLKIFKKI